MTDTEAIIKGKLKNLRAKVHAPSTVKLISAGVGISVTFSWLELAIRFKRYEQIKYQNTSHVIFFSIERIHKLKYALSGADVSPMTDEDAELLNWLELKDFRDAYRLYPTEKKIEDWSDLRKAMEAFGEANSLTTLD